MVLPTTSYLQVPWRVAFLAESKTSNQGERGAVRRLNVGLEAMETERSERLADHEPHGLRHVPSTGVRLESVVSKVGASKGTSHDLVEVDHAKQLARGSQAGHEALMRILTATRKIGAEQ